MLNLFVVEDEQIEREALIKLIRERYGTKIRVSGYADSAEVALNRIQAGPPDIILMDIQIPGFDGLELARRLREYGVDSQIVMVTAYSQFDYAQRAIRVGAVDYLVKPYSLRSLDEVIASVVERAEAHRAAAHAEKEELPAGAQTTASPTTRAREFIEENYTQDLTLNEIATHAGLSKYYLSRRFRTEFGVGPKEFTLRCRIRHARVLLQNGLTVAEAAYASGFEDPNYFSRVVKKYTGLTPRTLKESN